MGGITGGLTIATEASSAAAGNLSLSDFYQSTKFAIFSLVLEQLETLGLTAEKSQPRAIRNAIEDCVHRYAATEGLALNSTERVRLADELYQEVSGLGPLDPLLRDPLVDDIIVNGPRQVFVERGGRLSSVPVRFRDDAHLMNIIHRIVGPIGRRIDEANPYVDARLPDGSRVNVIIPPVALDGPMVSIRKFKPQPMLGEDYVRAGSISRDMLDFLANAVASRLNILVSGGTGSGKTTLLNMLSGYIDDSERLITIEDAAELRLRQEHVVRLETRPANVDGAREISSRDLMRNALRMRPDRVILGEVRGAEAVEMLQAMSTGHDGSMATLHANSDRDALGRLEMLLGFGGLNGEIKTLRRFIANSIQLIVFVQRMADGRRRVTSISELTGLEGEAYSLNQLYRFNEQPPLSGQGEFETMSARPFFAHRLKTAGGPPRLWGATKL